VLWPVLCLQITKFSGIKKGYFPFNKICVVVPKATPSVEAQSHICYLSENSTIWGTLFTSFDESLEVSTLSLKEENRSSFRNVVVLFDCEG
jgi:hypothetical protein